MAELGVDMMTLSAHKIGGPKGVGALLLAPDIEIQAILSGEGRKGDAELVLKTSQRSLGLVPQLCK